MASPNQKLQPKGTQHTPQTVEATFVRWTMFGIAVFLLVVAFSLRMRPSLLPRDTLLMSDLLGKVGLVMLCAWIAWPALYTLWQSPGRLILFSIIAVAGILFLYRPKTLYFTGPFVAIAAILAVLTGWVRKNVRY
jgi:hypothetical protein